MFRPVARVTRGGLTESWHLAAAAVCSPDDRLLARVGEPGLETFVRSAAKPFQLLPLLLAGGEAAFGLEAADLAVICASHSGRPEHVERVRRLLEKGDFSVAALQCGAHWPTDTEAAETLRAAGEAPTPLHNNCSGKHAGMLLACRLLGAAPETYLETEHPLQERIRELVASLCGVEGGKLPTAVDGCSAPTFWLPLRAVARGYAALLAPRAAGLGEDLAAAADKALEAMAAAPTMVAGPGRFTTRLLEVTGGRIVGKEGAEGYYALAARSPEPLGLALKIADGGERCRDAVVLALLGQLGALEPGELEQLQGFRRPALLNHRGLAVGEIVAEAELSDVRLPQRG